MEQVETQRLRRFHITIDADIGVIPEPCQGCRLLRCNRIKPLRERDVQRCRCLLLQAIVIVVRSSPGLGHKLVDRSEEHTSELPSLMRTSYAVSCSKTKI